MAKKTVNNRTSSRREKRNTRSDRIKQREISSEDTYTQQSDSQDQDTNESDQEIADTDMYDVRNYQFLLQCYEQLYNVIIEPQVKLESALQRQIAQNQEIIEMLKKMSTQQIQNLQGIKKVLDSGSQSNAPLIQQLINGLSSQSNSFDIKEAQNMVSSQLSKTEGRELQIQDLQTSIHNVKKTSQMLHQLNDTFIALSLLTGITITPGQNKNDAAKFINETRLPAETQSFVFSLGNVNDRKNYVGQLIIHDDGKYSISCLRTPQNKVLSGYKETFNDLDQENLQYIIQQFINTSAK